MAIEIKTEININAPPEKIWDVLLNFEKYPDWNPFIKEIQGNAKSGESIKLKIQIPDSIKMDFKPTISNIIPNQELSWVGKFIIKGIFDGKHEFIIKKTKLGSKLIHKEVFSGFLVRLMPGSFFDKTKRGFELMNKELKKRVEKK